MACGRKCLDKQFRPKEAELPNRLFCQGQRRSFQTPQPGLGGATLEPDQRLIISGQLLAHHSPPAPRPAGPAWKSNQRWTEEVWLNWSSPRSRPTASQHASLSHLLVIAVYSPAGMFVKFQDVPERNSDAGASSAAASALQALGWSARREPSVCHRPRRWPPSASGVGRRPNCRAVMWS